MSGHAHNVADRFREVVEQHRACPAIIWSAREAVTYDELDCLSNQAAAFLLQRGVRKGDRVCLRLDKCTLAYSLVLGCLKIGAPYFFIDPANPEARANHIATKCEPKLIFSDKDRSTRFGDYPIVSIDREKQFACFEGLPSDSPATSLAVIGTDPAYIMFTSGSTGFPKGATMSHGNLLNFINWARQEFSVTGRDIFTNVNPLFFDNSVFDFYASVMNGAALAPFDADTMRDPYAVLRRIDELGCTIYFSVPSLLIYFQTLKMITPAALAHVRTVIFGGEGYPKPKLKELFDCLHHRIEFVNVYGPTECTCICSAYRVTETDFDDLDGYPPLGGPIANFLFTILDENDNAASLDEIGELCLGGPGVGLGYYNDPHLTETAFVQNPLNRSYSERIYRTGDLVRRSSIDGKVHFAGRKDDQIKHQGYRIELGEIEHALTQVEGVDEAVALHSARDGVSMIVAVVGSSNDVAPADIRHRLSAMLPAYMLPSRTEVMPRLPKNDNGKIDRKLLKSRYQ